MKGFVKKSLQQLFNEFLFECEFARKVRPETIRGYRQTFELFNRLIPDVTLELITVSTMIRFFKVLEVRKRTVGRGQIRTGVKKSTIATYWSKLSCFFTWLAVKQLIEKNPFNEMRFPIPVYEDRKFMKRGEVEKILTAILKNPSGNLLILKRNLVIFHILLLCGLRREELLLLQLRDVDLERKLLTVRAETSKTPRTRLIPLHSQVIMHLKDYLEVRKKYTTQYLVVSNSRDNRYSQDGLKHLVRTLKETSGVNFHLHQFRHTFAVNFLRSNRDIFKLKQLMGHKDIKTTMAYLRCLPAGESQSDIENLTIDSFY